jgi:hypothetical protein
MLKENELDSIYLMKVPLIVQHRDDLHDGKSLGKIVIEIKVQDYKMD